MSSYFTPVDQLKSFLAKPGDYPAMNDMYGISALLLTDKAAARLLPPPLSLADPEHPLLYLYVVNIRQPTFSPWYMEAGLGLMAKYNGKQGVYFFNLQLCGPGAEMALDIGRENAGIPKKLADRIVVERSGDTGHCFVERGGVRLCDVELTMGRYDIPLLHVQQEGCTPQAPIDVPGGSFLYKYDFRDDAREGFRDMRLLHYESPARYYGWEPARAKVSLRSSDNDPWGELPVLGTMLAGWQTCDNGSAPGQELWRAADGEEQETMQYLLAGRFDRCTVTREHQLYG